MSILAPPVVCPRCGWGEKHKLGGSRCRGLRKTKQCREASPIGHSGHSWNHIGLRGENKKKILATYWCDGT